MLFAGENRARWLEWFELAAVFGLLPFLLSLGTPAPLRRAVLFAACFYALFRLKGRVDWKRLWAKPWKGWWKGPLIRAALAAAGLTAWVLLLEPGEFLNFPRQRPGLWLLVMLLYPPLSVAPQEIIYRVFIFTAHRRALASPFMRVAVSAILFGWLHIIYAGSFAVLTSTAAGLCLGLNYNAHEDRQGALWPLVLEHALYGQLVFTLGLGRYFFLARAGGVV